MVKTFFYICIFFILANCSNKTTYSGKILKNEELQNVNFANKANLINICEECHNNIHREDTQYVIKKTLSGDYNLVKL